ncbi:serine hydrolase [Brevibacillus sp. 7WMA2]|nr:serine hydrolase [Brevibacillus sp. 7WMA2]
MERCMMVKQQSRKYSIFMFVVILSIAILFPTSYAYSSPIKEPLLGPTDSKEVEDFADQFFNQSHIKNQLAGAVFVIVRDGRILLNKGYGYSDVEKKIAVNPNHTIFPLASISKVFTSTGIMQLVEQGKLDLDEDIQTYLEDITLNNKTTDKLTMKHLLTNTAGFDFTDKLESIHHHSIPRISLDKYVKENMPSIVRKPGEAFRYDNFGFSLQGYILEKLSGKSFNQYMTENIFTPLKMENSSFLLTPQLKANLATGYTSSNQPFPVFLSNPIEQPEGGMVSTGHDMAQFMMAHLNKGSFEGRTILKQGTAQNMHTIHYSVHPKVPNMAYGFETYYHSSHNNQFVIGKGGDIPGFHSWMWLLPEHKVGGFIVFNKDKEFREELFKAFMNHYYPIPKKEQTYMTSSPQQLKRFEGTYRDLRINPWITKITVTSQGQLLAEDPMGKNILRQIDPMLFKDEKGTFLAFKESADGSIGYLQYRNMVSMAQKISPSRHFADVPQSHPYAAYINGVQDFGVLQGDSNHAFHPLAPMTRAEFAGDLVRLIGVRASTNPVSFIDSKKSPYVKEIQALVEADALKGTSPTKFEPNRPITRQEAAVIVFEVSKSLLNAQPVKVNLKGAIDPWATQAVQYVVFHGLYGPEVISSKGLIDYKAKEPLLRQEAAAFLYNYARHIFKK